MPYINKHTREQLQEGFCPNSPGELNYLLTQVVRRYLKSRGDKYQTHNDIIGALDSAKLEYYRRVVVPYEDRKMLENGDVY